MPNTGSALYSISPMKKAGSLILAIVFTISLPHSLYAWGKKGHGIVAEIAHALSDSNTNKAVQKYLGATTIEEASTWMDEVRSDHKYDYMKTWHYVNIEKGNQYVETKDGNIINALNNAITELEHKDKLNDEEIKKNLMIIFHLTGDLHMPLHVGYGIDNGGNDIQVKYLGNPTNLHRVWDTEIIEGENITANDCLLLYNRFDKSEIAQFKEINIENWIHEPRALLSNVYNFKDGIIDQAYVDRNKTIVKQQLLIAGIRLAAVLEKIFQS
ncbi:MAG: S1/P1 nuclease [Chitinophagales bacterium]